MELNELREKIAELIGEAFVSCGTYRVEREAGLETADAILSLEPIAQALTVVKTMENR